MSDVAEVILLAGAIVLLPLIPAFLLYKFLPAETHVRGPFKGFSVQLTGSFAGYFLIALGTGGFVREQLKAQHLAQLWTVRGVVKVVPDGHVLPSADVNMVVRPPVPSGLQPDGTFEIGQVPVSSDPQTQFMLEVSAPNRETRMVHFWRVADDSLYGVKYDGAKHVIEIGKPLVLAPSTQGYAAAAAAVIPVPVPDTAHNP